MQLLGLGWLFDGCHVVAINKQKVTVFCEEMQKTYQVSLFVIEQNLDLIQQN